MINLEQAKKNIPTILKKGLDKKGITQAKLAELVGCDKTAISHYLKGSRVPSMEILISLCDILEIDLNSFKTGEFSKAPNIDAIPTDSKDILYAIATLMKADYLKCDKNEYRFNWIFKNEYTAIEEFAVEFSKYINTRFSKRDEILSDIIEYYTSDLEQEIEDKKERNSDDFPF